MADQGEQPGLPQGGEGEAGSKRPREDGADAEDVPPPKTFATVGDAQNLQALSAGAINPFGMMNPMMGMNPALLGMPQSNPYQMNSSAPAQSRGYNGNRSSQAASQPDDDLARRRAQNRKWAQASRQRKKEKMGMLEKQVKEQQELIDTLKEEYDRLGKEVGVLRAVVGLMAQKADVKLEAGALSDLLSASPVAAAAGVTQATLAEYIESVVMTLNGEAGPPTASAFGDGGAGGASDAAPAPASVPGMATSGPMGAGAPPMSYGFSGAGMNPFSLPGMTPGASMGMSMPALMNMQGLDPAAMRMQMQMLQATAGAGLFGQGFPGVPPMAGQGDDQGGGEAVDAAQGTLNPMHGLAEQAAAADASVDPGAGEVKTEDG